MNVRNGKESCQSLGSKPKGTFRWWMPLIIGAFFLGLWLWVGWKLALFLTVMLCLCHRYEGVFASTAITHAQVAECINRLGANQGLSLRLEESISPLIVPPGGTDEDPRWAYKEDMVVCVCSNMLRHSKDTGTREVAIILLYQGKYQGERGFFYTYLSTWAIVPYPFTKMYARWYNASQMLKVDPNEDASSFPNLSCQGKKLVFQKVPEW